jgi:hypothetical protein
MELPMEFPSVIPSVNPLVIKKYYYRGIYRRNEAGNFIFLFSTDKKLPMKASPTEHFLSVILLVN